MSTMKISSTPNLNYTGFKSIYAQNLKINVANPFKIITNGISTKAILNI